MNKGIYLGNIETEYFSINWIYVNMDPVWLVGLLVFSIFSLFVINIVRFITKRKVKDCDSIKKD